MTRGPELEANAAQVGKAVQFDLFDGLGPVMPSKLTAHPLYSVWNGMKQRCNNPKSPVFKDYGGRGIVVCDEWRNSPMAFIAWALANGWRPGLQLDRRDNDGPYSPENCRFVTRKVNMANRRNTLRLSDGRAVAVVAAENGISEETLRWRVKAGWTADEAVGAVPRKSPGSDGRGRAFRLADGRSGRAVALANGISSSVFWLRVNRGWTPDEAAGVVPRKVADPVPAFRLARISDGRPAWPVAQANGVKRQTFSSRLRAGWTPDEAAGVVFRHGAPRPPEPGVPLYRGRVSRHPLYPVWFAMKARCLNEADPAFKNYGGRGITVCAEWQSSRAFIAWALANGWRPGLQLDRRDNDGPYSPENCRFVTRKVNMANRRNTFRLSDGRAAFAVALANGISSSAFRSRVNRGWTPDEAAGVVPRELYRPSRRAAGPVRQSEARPASGLPSVGGVMLSDGRPAWPAAQANGVKRHPFRCRLKLGWTPEQAAGIAPPPQRRQNGAGRAQPASDVRQGRKSRKAAVAPAPGRCDGINKMKGRAK